MEILRESAVAVLRHFVTSGDGAARLWDLKRIPGGSAFLPPPPSAK
jgi:hypothetical protein